ncbi:TATA box-binding protein-associated factor RNA polymerase I subunit B-like [Homarus americanus]|uniref:TATA box-binding protein-associated factor RNA polymerase I subunit B-like n=1 Tax=Homarus americanus TaxID=6706 RepID=UPI001C4786F6|nr:TATA box-binding protein-associated factor RNA polymerase I subunit B-like [Homarus americanus]
MAQECFECGGTSFSQDGGCRICDECGTVQKRYIEQLSQEDFCDVNRSRLINMIDDGDGDLDMTIQRDYDDDDINNWTTYEMFNVVLHEWTKALCNLGASSHFQQIVFKLWVMYLQHSKLAFKPPTDDEETKTETRNISVHETRDVELITKKQKSVSATSMKFRRNKAKKKTTKKLSELEKLKGKVIVLCYYLSGFVCFSNTEV